MPGDVFLTLGNEGKVNKATCNLGFMVLNDIAGGTNIAFAFNAKWQGGVDRVAFEDEDLNGFVWIWKVLGGFHRFQEQKVCRPVAGLRLGLLPL